ncbi:MAG: DUF1493 family protein, partial [Flavobacterium sp.]
MKNFATDYTDFIIFMILNGCCLLVAFWCLASYKNYSNCNLFLGIGIFGRFKTSNQYIKMEELLAFLKDEIGFDEVFEDSDIERDLGSTGDDFSELMEKYALRYNVDMDSYLWYFHHAEEGLSGMSFFSRPNELVKHIPVTPRLLYAFAQKGKWDLAYPEHELPKTK